MGNSRTHRVASLNESTAVAVEAQCLMRAGRHGGPTVEVRVTSPAAPGFQRLSHVYTMQMINRLDDLLQASPGAVLDDWFELEAGAYTHVVTFDTALHVKLAVDQVPQPEWVEFTDLFGAKHCLRPQDVLRISESTPGTRARVRAFLRARETGIRSGQHSANA